MKDLLKITIVVLALSLTVIIGLTGSQGIVYGLQLMNEPSFAYIACGIIIIIVSLILTAFLSFKVGQYATKLFIYINRPKK